jgi:Uma2 family endonuclease
MKRLTDPLPGTVPDPLYPDSDEENEGETDFHVQALIWLREALKMFFARVRDVYVAADMFWYWEQGNPRACRAPDVMVAKDVGNHLRRSFRSWEEGGIRPCTIFEIVSERTVHEDLEDKRILYESLGVPEYFLFDPEGPYLTPPLQGFRLRKGRYVPMQPTSDGSLTSRELGLRLTPEGSMLRLRNARTGRRVLTHSEQAERASRQAERQRRQAEKQRQRDEQRMRELEAELARLRGQQ